MKKTQYQDGFGAIEALLILIVVLLIGFIGYYVYNVQKEAAKNLATVSTSSQGAKKTAVTATIDPYKDWSTCNDQTRHVTIKYPVSWKSNTGDELNPCSPYTESSTMDKLLEVKSAKTGNKLFRFWYIPLGKPYNQNDVSDLQKVVSIEPVTTLAGQKLNLIGYVDEYNDDQSALSGISVSDQKYVLGQTFRGYPTITNKSDKQFVLDVDLTKDDGGDAESYSPNVYKAQPAYQDLVKIFTSVSY